MKEKVKASKAKLIYPNSWRIYQKEDWKKRNKVYTKKITKIFLKVQVLILNIVNQWEFQQEILMKLKPIIYWEITKMNEILLHQIHSKFLEQTN